MVKSIRKNIIPIVILIKFKLVLLSKNFKLTYETISKLGANNNNLKPVP